MAERLNVTKGSYYWHVRDLDDFLDALTRKWAEEMGTQYLATARGPDEHPSTRMQNLLRVFLSRPVRMLDREMRHWARNDERVRRWSEPSGRSSPRSPATCASWDSGTPRPSGGRASSSTPAPATPPWIIR